MANAGNWNNSLEAVLGKAPATHGTGSSSRDLDLDHDKQSGCTDEYHFRLFLLHRRRRRLMQDSALCMAAGRMNSRSRKRVQLCPSSAAAAVVLCRLRGSGYTKSLLKAPRPLAVDAVQQ